MGSLVEYSVSQLTPEILFDIGFSLNRSLRLHQRDPAEIIFVSYEDLATNPDFIRVSAYCLRRYFLAERQQFLEYPGLIFPLSFVLHSIPLVWNACWSSLELHSYHNEIPFCCNLVDIDDQGLRFVMIDLSPADFERAHRTWGTQKLAINKGILHSEAFAYDPVFFQTPIHMVYLNLMDGKTPYTKDEIEIFMTRFQLKITTQYPQYTSHFLDEKIVTQLPLTVLENTQTDFFWTRDRITSPPAQIGAVLHWGFKQAGNFSKFEEVCWGVCDDL